MAEGTTFWMNAKRLGLTTFSMPAAIGVLDKYEKNLQLSALLKRIVRNYDALINAFWTWLKSFLPLPPDLDIRFWTFFILIMTPAALEFLRHRFTGHTITFGKPRFWGLASSIAFIGYCIAFSTGNEMIAALADYALFFVTLIVVVLIAVIASDPLSEKLKHLDLSERTQTLVFWVGFLVLLVVFSLFLRFAVDPVSDLAYEVVGARRDGGMRGIAIFATLCIAAFFAFGNLRTPAYVFFWMFGLIAIDWAATEFVPSINESLDSILCEGEACS